MILIIFLIFDLGGIFKEWKREERDLYEMMKEYIKSESPYENDYVYGLFIVDILQHTDSSERKNVYEVLYSNYKGDCVYSNSYPDALKFFSLRCYIKKDNSKKAEYVFNSITDRKIRCMSLYFLGKFFMKNGKKEKGKSYLKESILKCKQVVPIWSRDILF